MILLKDKRVYSGNAAIVINDRQDQIEGADAVSYTHLDVYKRQTLLHIQSIPFHQQI